VVLEEIVKEHEKAAITLAHTLSEDYKIALRNGWHEAHKYFNEELKNGNVTIKNN